MQLLKSETQLKASFSTASATLPFTLDIGRLREDERIELRYDDNSNLVAIQKIRIALFERQMEGRAESEILPGERGRVYFNGTTWNARSEGRTKISSGQKVLVTARYSSTLLVLPA